MPGGIPVYPDKAPVSLPTPPIDPESGKMKTVISQERQKKISTVKKPLIHKVILFYSVDSIKEKNYTKVLILC